jgi:hypothetical protein
VAKREKYLEWAAEVTSTIDVDKLHAKQAEAAGSLVIPPPQPAPRQPSSTSLPAAGAPVAPVPPVGGPAQVHRSDGQNSAAASVVTSAPTSARRPQLAPMASSSLLDDDEEIPTMVANREDFSALGMEPGAAPPPAAGFGVGDADSDDELNVTIALQQDAPAMEIRAAVGELRPHAPTLPFAGDQQHFPPLGQQHLQTGPDQAAIETKMSMPRPAAVAEWAAQQGELSLQAPRSTAVLMAIAVLSTLCFIGIAALLFHRAYRAPGANTKVPAADASAETSAASSVASREGRSPAGADTSEAEVAKSAGASSAKVATAKAPTTRAKRAAAKDTKAKAPGYLTVFCKPACDRVVAAGRSLGASPVVNHPLPPGQHRLTLRHGSVTKTLSIIVESGELVSRRVTMK